MLRKTGNAQSRATFLRHSAVLSLLAALLRKVPIERLRNVQKGQMFVQRVQGYGFSSLNMQICDVLVWIYDKIRTAYFNRINMSVVRTTINVGPR